MAEYIVVDLMGDVCVGGKTPKEAALIAEQRLARCYKKAAPRKKAAPKEKKA
jgi:hypothetical protein